MYVWVEAPEADRPEPSPTVEGPSTASQSRSAEHDQLVESLLDQVKYMREQLAAEREANRENRRLLAAALERIPAIEPPETRGARDTVSDGEYGTETSAGDTGEPRRSWWRRFFGFE